MRGREVNAEVIPRQILLSAFMVVSAFMVAAAAVEARAETCSLRLRRLESPDVLSGTSRPVDAVFSYTTPQHFFMQFGIKGTVASDRNGEARFADVVKKEPASYKSKYPFRGVAKLGTQQFGFVLDNAVDEAASDKPASDKPASDKPASDKPASDKPASDKPASDKPASDKPASDKPASDKNKQDKKQENPKGPSSPPVVYHYDRLYFDLNHNGDLTDDPVIEAEKTRATASAGYAQYTFPRVDLSLDVDGTKVEYAFRFSVYSSRQQDFQYASASLSAAAYREGEITLNGKQRRIVLVDFNSNGRFDDPFAIDASVMASDGSVYPRQGDMIYVDPQLEKVGYRYGYDVTTSDEQHYVAKLINLDGRFYELNISPAGDQLTLTPSSVAVGYVTNPNQGYRAVVYGAEGLLKICGGASGRAPLPAGEWNLLAYTIDRTGLAETAKPPDNTPSLLQSLAKALLGSKDPIGSRITLVAARGKRDFPAVQVRQDETVEVRFGPPYKPTVTGSAVQPDGKLSLGMSLIGSTGEVCSNLLVDGSRPAKPQFTITTPDGKEVERGSFEYG